MGGVGSGKGIRLQKWHKKRFIDELQQFDAFRLFQANGRLYGQHDSIASTQLCQFGGKKYYWICPRCRRKCRFLYFASTRGGCRVCLNLVYRSQNETLADRLLRKREKIQQKIIWSPFYAEKPKYMHKKTFDAFCRQAEFYWNSANQAFMISARKMSDLNML